MSASSKIIKRGSFGAAIVVVLAVATGANMWFPSASPPGATAALPQLPRVTVSTPLNMDVTDFTDFTGQFSAVSQVEIRAQVGGYITEIHFRDGEIVRKGDLLFVIDPRPYEIQLRQALAQRDTATAALDFANKQLGRTAQLHRESFASGEVLDQRTQGQRSATAAAEQAAAAVRSAELNLVFTRIVAPFNGRVSLRNVSIGSLVTAGASAWPPLTTIVSLNPIHLDFDMSEVEYLAYRRYQAIDVSGSPTVVQASLSDETEFSRRGTLDFIDNAVNRGSGTVHARATLLNSDLLIAPGQFARLRLPMSKPRKMLLVPDAAIVTDQSHKVVMVLGDGDVIVPKLVELGALHGDKLRVVTSGLAPEDRVVINGVMRARPGARVAPHAGKITAASSD